MAASHVSLWGHSIPDQPPEEGRKSVSRDQMYSMQLIVSLGKQGGGKKQEKDSVAVNKISPETDAALLRQIWKEK